VAWQCYFRACPPLKPVPAHRSLWSCGFWTVAGTLQKIASGSRLASSSIVGGHQHHYYYRQLLLLLCAIVFAEAATQALIAIATTYMTSVLQMNSQQIGMVFLAVLVCGIPGAKLGGIVAKVAGTTQQCRGIRSTDDPVISAMVATVYFCDYTGILGHYRTGTQAVHAYTGSAVGTGFGLAQSHAGQCLHETPIHVDDYARTASGNDGLVLVGVEFVDVVASVGVYGVE
jgi:hypothetical protein